jgi:cyanophycinase
MGAEEGDDRPENDPMTFHRAARAGTVIAIGGNEDDAGSCDALAVVAAHARGGPLAVLTAASLQPERRWQRYEHTFRRLGVQALRHVRVDDRRHAGAAAELLGDAGGVFIAGGDQFRLLERVGGTAVHAAIAAVARRGGVVAGTSAGAAALGAVMVGGSTDPSAKTWLRTAPGLGLLPGAVVDQHCSQRGRAERLAAVVVRHAGMVGLGVDEDTAVVLDASGWLQVVGAGCVCVIDGHAGEPRDEHGADSAEARRGPPERGSGAPVRVLTAGDTHHASRAWRAPDRGPDGRATAALAS